MVTDVTILPKNLMKTDLGHVKLETFSLPGLVCMTFKAKQQQIFATRSPDKQSTTAIKQKNLPVGDVLSFTPDLSADVLAAAIKLLCLSQSPHQVLLVQPVSIGQSWCPCPALLPCCRSPAAVPAGSSESSRGSFL